MRTVWRSNLSDYSCLHVQDHAQSKRNLFLRELLHQPRVVDRSRAVTDPIYTPSDNCPATLTARRLKAEIQFFQSTCLPVRTLIEPEFKNRGSGAGESRPHFPNRVALRSVPRPARCGTTLLPNPDSLVLRNFRFRQTYVPAAGKLNCWWTGHKVHFHINQ